MSGALDRGPWLNMFLKAGGLPTNQIPIPSSYPYLYGFFQEAKNGSINFRQRDTAEVLYPSQKVTMECLALQYPQEWLKNFWDRTGTAHGRKKLDFASIHLFVDGHVAFVPWNARSVAPGVPQFYLNPPGFMDVR